MFRAIKPNIISRVCIMHFPPQALAVRQLLQNVPILQEKVERRLSALEHIETVFPQEVFTIWLSIWTCMSSR